MITSIFIQCMFRFCCEMTKYKLLLFLLILPALSKSKNVRTRRRPTLEQQTDAKHPLLDQVALANSWQAPNRVISASYASNPETGRIKHALVINLLPHQNQQPIVDVAASESLSNSQSAEEYVNRAMQMRSRLADNAPHSTYMKYDVYEKEQTKYLEPSQIEVPIKANKIRKPKSVLTRSSKQFGDYEFKYKPTTDYTKDLFGNDYGGDYGNGNSDYNSEISPSNTYTNHFTDSFDPHVETHQYENNNYKQNTYEKPYISESTKIQKSEILKQIEKSVLKYLKELEAEGKIQSNLVPSTTAKSHTEIKTYYRIPPTASGITSNRDPAEIYNELTNKVKAHTQYTSTHSEFFKRPTSPTPVQTYTTYTTYSPKGMFSTVSPSTYNTEEPTAVESVTPYIDLTFRSKARPKPLDLSALDVGQSWSHGSTTDSYGHYIRPTKKPKLHFNSQTYHDINSMSYSQENNGLLTSETYKTDSDGYPYIPNKAGKTKDGIANVAASISFGPARPEATVEAIRDLQEHYDRPLHLINGVAVTNPYKVNLDTLKQMLGQPDNKNNQQNWHPYRPPNHNYHDDDGDGGASSNVHENHVSSSTQHHNLPYDSYSPKYNNNPAGHGYQDSWEPSSAADSHRHRGTDMHASSSSNSSKKVKGTKLTIKHTKRPKTTVLKIGKANIKQENAEPKKNQGLDTELKPPPRKPK